MPRTSSGPQAEAGQPGFSGQRGAYAGFLALVTAVCIWGSTFVVTKNLLSAAGPFTILELRFGIALGCLLPFAWREQFRFGMVVQPRFLAFGLTGVALHYGLQNVGLLYTSAGTAAMIVAGIPVATALLSVALLRERLSQLQVVGITLSILGIVGVNYGSLATVGQGALVGNLLMVGSVLAWAMYTVQGKQLTVSYSSLVMACASIAAGSLMLLPFAIGEIWLGQRPQFHLPALLSIVYLGVGASAVTFYLWNHALRLVTASVAGSFLNLAPVVGLILAVLLGERVGVVQALGGATAVVGVFLHSFATQRREPA